MLRFLILLATATIALSCFGQKNDPVIMTIGNYTVSKDEFVRLYKKNNKQLLDDSDKKTPKDYVQLFVNYKLKVLEAERLSYDTIPSFINELKSYRDQLAKPYLTAVQHTDQMVTTAYERMQSEIKASHILLRVNEHALPADTLLAWNKINEIRNELLQGADFGELAVKYSQDPSAKKNKGELGYFSAFQMVYPFETMCYTTELGKISLPVRTSFGYHLIKVIDKRPSKGRIKVAHIMKRIVANSSEESVNKRKQVLDSLLEELKNGADFADLAKTNSDDRQTAAKGGELSWFTSTSMMPEFAEPAFTLKNDNDLSPVIRTPFGWHIIKRIAYQPPSGFDEMKESLTNKIRNNPAISKHNKEIFILELKKTYQFKKNSAVYQLFADSATSRGHYKKPAEIDSTQILFSFADQKLSCAQFTNYLDKISFNKSSNNIDQQLFEQFDNFIAETLIKYEDQHLEQKHPDFNYLMKEYHDGILLFNISEDKIWDAAMKDSIGLNYFFSKNNDNHKWEERFQGWRIKCNTQKEKDFIAGIFDVDPQIHINELKDQLNKYFKENKINIVYGKFEKGADSLIDYLVWNSVEPEDYKNGLHFIRGNKIELNNKSLEEAKGLYISDYQDYLEDKWLKELQKRYKVKVNKKVLKTIVPVI